LDLNYQEDANAEADLNIVMNADGNFIEVQGTGEGAVFSRSELDQMLNVAERGIQELLEFQAQCLE
jgi:ribonuclease PH